MSKKAERHWTDAQGVADHLKIHRSTVYALLRDGLPSHRARPGARARYDLDEVDAWMERATAPLGAPAPEPAPTPPEEPQEARSRREEAKALELRLRALQSELGALEARLEEHRLAIEGLSVGARQVRASLTAVLAH